jgi:hypothetical protein
MHVSNYPRCWLLKTWILIKYGNDLKHEIVRSVHMSISLLSFGIQEYHSCLNWTRKDPNSSLKIGNESQDPQCWKPESSPNSECLHMGQYDNGNTGLYRFSSKFGLSVSESEYWARGCPHADILYYSFTEYQLFIWYTRHFRSWLYSPAVKCLVLVLTFHIIIFIFLEQSDGSDRTQDFCHARRAEYANHFTVQ